MFALVTSIYLQKAQTTGNGNVAPRRLGLGYEHKFHITGNGTISAGAIQLEESDDPDYTGTWAPIGSPIDLVPLSGNKKQTVSVQGQLKAVRARITTNVTGGGTVSVKLISV